jgi:hypothetical protein
MNPSSRDAGIPVLTEIISPSAETDEQNSGFPSIPLFGEDPVPSPPVTCQMAAAPESNVDAFEFPSVPVLSEEEWENLERRIGERILIQIQSKVDAMLEQRIRDSLADVLQVALEGLTVQLRDGLHKSLEDVISHAVSQEISRMQTTKK